DQVRTSAVCSRSSARAQSPDSRYAVRSSRAERAATNSLNPSGSATRSPSSPHMEVPPGKREWLHLSAANDFGKMFDGAPELPSAVCVDPSGRLLAGQDA